MIPNGNHSTPPYAEFAAATPVHPNRWGADGPRSGRRWVETPPADRQALTREEVELLYSWCNSERDRLIIALLFEAGLRVGEILGLRHEDIDLINQRIWIVPRTNSNGAQIKARVPVYIPVGATILERYHHYLLDTVGSSGSGVDSGAVSDYVFINTKRGRIGSPMKRWSIDALCLRLGKKLGRHIHSHLGRHTWGTYLAEMNIALPTIQRLMRHSNLATTLMYIHSNNERMVDALAAVAQAHDPYVIAQKRQATLDVSGSAEDSGTASYPFASERDKD